MGQASSRRSPPPSVSRAHHPQPSPPSSSSAGYDSSPATPRDGLDSISNSATPSTKTSQRSSPRRSVRSFLRPRTQSDTTSPSSSSQIPSFRKRWRSSRRFSKAQASLPNLSETLQDADRPPAAPAAAVDAQLLAVEEQPAQIESSSSAPFLSLLPPASCSTTSNLSRALPVVDANADAPSMDDHGASQDHAHATVAEQSLATATNTNNKPDTSSQFHEHPERAQEIEREITDFLLERPRQDSLFVEGSSQDGQLSVSDAAPEPSPPYASSALPEAEGAADAQAQAPRHFPPPGTLVVVQGVVNTSDTPSTTQPSAPSRQSRPASAVNPAGPLTVPARRSSSVPRGNGQPEERQSARSRLSALLPRTTSMRRQRSSTSDPNAAPLHGSHSTSDVSSSAFESSESSDYLADGSDPLSNSTTAEAGAAEDNDPRSRPLSPGSIDVLGTLLSVAAAATAASLFSPTLGFQANSDPNAPAQPPPAIPRPMSPTPTAGLGGGPAFGLDMGTDPLAAAPPASSPLPQQREGRERIRNVWESFRERLGLNRGTTPQAGAGAPANADEPGNMRPGEIMLAEMARALNVGLGLTGDGSSAGTGANAAAGAADPAAEHTEAVQGEGARPAEAAPSVRPPPPEDSFERFLLDLQADLRVALSESGVAGGSQAAPDANAHANSGGDEGAVTASHTQHDHDHSPEEHSHGEAHERSPSGADEEADDSDGPPPLDDVSDSEGEGEDYDDADVDEHPSTRIPTPMPRELPHRGEHSPPGASASGRTPAAAAAADERGEAERRPPGIHLWRLYRFRPIHATQIAGHAAATPAPTAPGFPQQGPAPGSVHAAPASPLSSVQAEGLAHPHPGLSSGSGSGSGLSGASSGFGSGSGFSSQSPPSPSHTSPQTAGASASERDGAESPSSSAPPATDPNANMVVPVIVVGLQSVEMGQVHGHAHPPGPGHAHGHHEPDGMGAMAPEDDWMPQGRMDEGMRMGNGAGGGEQGDATPRGRSWQSRAATALRNLRPGRRNAPGGQQAAEGTGSRTFLIYVIGGYYPPNHHMVTGPDNLDSYEALWELAELLGQVKPQVATREDIDKSDLQTVKYTDLEQYEREGRVASNCVERCLICLDDYQPEDDVRLMHCRHAFHKDCVDKWLQVGRNNCPACRTKGVSTADEIMP